MKYFKIDYKFGKKRSSIVLEAANKIEAMEKFFEMELGVLVKIQETSKPLEQSFQDLLAKYNDPVGKKKVDQERLIALLDQMAIMLDAGLPLNYTLSEVTKHQEDKALKAIFEKVLNDIESGKGFYASVLPFQEQLGRLTVAMIQLGEETGQIAESLTHLTDILQDILDNRKKFKKATRYPLVIVTAMGIAFSVVTIFVIPQFKSIFESSQMELPLPTKFLLWLEYALRVYGPYILAGAVLLAITISYMYKKSDKVHMFLDKLILKIYIIGKATFFAMISRFVYVFSVLVKAGIPMLEALRIASGIIDNVYIKQKVDKIASAIEEGKSLNQGFEETELFENMVVEMIKAGETGGGLDKMLQKVVKIYKDRFSYIVDNIATLIEPILLGAIAGFVLMLALGIFLPMWNMVDMAN
ncbi:type II secretion system F family protein [Sulfurimonas sp. SWIR-19]|uniref:type II secretion system F family protein n=1 Tax=Sulfurimonas sp. SWIR-19 TaxID=2878390 RepID=UPI001CF4A69E|nr:type II secretion system F family protein [Sulfurimonas sp. SWIR-19]UCN00781.1 type II secretion system F family protein [Sulfurimonas sp. SWIR-19]